MMLAKNNAPSTVTTAFKTHLFAPSSSGGSGSGILSDHSLSIAAGQPKAAVRELEPRVRIETEPYPEMLLLGPDPKSCTRALRSLAGAAWRLNMYRKKLAVPVIARESGYVLTAIVSSPLETWVDLEAGGWKRREATDRPSSYTAVYLTLAE